MQPTMRKYQNEDDYWRIRDFLRAVFLRNDRRRICWQTARLDYWRWHFVKNCGAVESMEEVIFLWETPDNQIVAVVHADYMRKAVLQVHPDWKTAQLEEAMLDVAEKHLSVPGKRFLVSAFQDDTLRQEILTQRGYRKHDDPAYQWRRCLDQPLPDISIPEGYTVRPIEDKDLPSRSWTSWRAFHSDDPDEDYEGWEWSLNWKDAPLYRRDLDIVAVDDKSGDVVAYCVLWYDDVTRSGLFDPVAVHPDHQRRGLGKAVVTEAMRRARRMGATLATVSGYESGANALYKSALSPEYDWNEPWIKEF